MSEEDPDLVVGVDEAGKGPVLGSMYIAAVATRTPDALHEDIRDSKEIPDGERAELNETIRDAEETAFAIVEVTPAQIDAPDANMTALTAAAQAAAAGVVGDTGSRLIVDAGEQDTEKFKRRVSNRLAFDPGEFIAEHEADATYPVVGAASIIAKTAREDAVARLENRFEREVGSGYPSDPTTKAFLEEYVAETGELPGCARASWGTSQEILDGISQTALTEY